MGGLVLIYIQCIFKLKKENKQEYAFTSVFFIFPYLRQEFY